MSDNGTVKFHLSLNVTHITRSVAFYRLLFGVEPAKCHDDYAKFELDDPPVVFSLVPRPPGPGGSLSHLGFRVASAEQLQQTQQRLTEAGLCTQDQNGTVCGYTRQDKFWVKDPDENFWEVYVALEEVEKPLAVRRSLDGPAPREEEAPAGAVVWEHYLANPLGAGIPHGDEETDEVRLTGTFNAPLDEEALARLLREVFRVLRPTGKVVVHGLMGDAPLPGSQPKLPGLAALVSRVPTRPEVIGRLTAAGLIGVQVVKLTDRPWFVHEGVGLREVKLIAWKPPATPSGGMKRVLYKGPFAEVKADGGWVFPRGQRIDVPASVWEQLRVGTGAEQFLFLEPTESCSPSPCACS